MSGPLVHLYSTGRAIAGLTAASAMPRSTSRAAIRFESPLPFRRWAMLLLPSRSRAGCHSKENPAEAFAEHGGVPEGAGGFHQERRRHPRARLIPLGGVCNGRSWAEATLRTGSPKLHPGLVAIRELDAGRFEDGAHGLHILARDERLAEATLRTLDGMRLNSRSLGKFGLSPAEQLSRRPDLSAGGHSVHPSLSAFSCSGTLPPRKF